MKHLPCFTVRCTALYVSSPVLSTPHQYVPVSVSRSPPKVTLKVPSPQSFKVILSDSDRSPAFTDSRISSLLLQGFLQKYFLLLRAFLCEHWNKTFPRSNPSAVMSVPSVCTAAKVHHPTTVKASLIILYDT